MELLTSPPFKTKETSNVDSLSFLNFNNFIIDNKQKTSRHWGNPFIGAFTFNPAWIKALAKSSTVPFVLVRKHISPAWIALGLSSFLG